MCLNTGLTTTFEFILVLTQIYLSENESKHWCVIILTKVKKEQNF